MAPLRRLAALLVVAAIGSCLGTEHEEETQQLPVACPVNSWCLPTGLCDPDYVIFDAKNPMEGSAPGEYVCGVTDTTVNYVCCDTQELLPHHFKPTPFRWYFQRKGSNIEGGLVVAPWPTFTIDDLEELENQNELHIDDDDDFEKDIPADDSKQDHDASEGEDINDGYVVEPDSFPSPTRNDGTSNEDLLAQGELYEELLRLRETERELLELQYQLAAEGREGRAVSTGGRSNRVMDRYPHMQGSGMADMSQIDEESPAVGDVEKAKATPTGHGDLSVGGAHLRRSDELGSRSEPDDDLPVPHICPSRSMCVPWNLCDAWQVLFDAESSQEKEYLCGLTEDSEMFVCCRRPSFLADQETGAPAPAPAADAANGAGPAAGSPPGSASASDPSSRVAEDTVPDSDVVQLPLDHLAELFSAFSPPPSQHATTAAPTTNRGSSDGLGSHGHYLEGVLLKERPKREIQPPPPSQGRVIYPSQIAAERLREVQRAAAAADGQGGDSEGTPFRNTLGGRLKPAGSLGTVKLGGLTPPPPRPSSRPDVRRELPILPPLPSPAPIPAPTQSPPLPSPPAHSNVEQEHEEAVSAGVAPAGAVPEAHEETAVPQKIAVTPRTVPQLEDVDIRPLRAEMWRGMGPDVPVGPVGRSAAGDADSRSVNSLDAEEETENKPGSLLSRILDSLPGGSVSSRHGSQQGQETPRGRFFGAPRPPLPLHRPTQPPRHGARPPFHQPEPFQPDHFQPGRFQPDHFQPGNFQPGFQPGFQPDHFQPGNFQPGHFQPEHFQPGGHGPGTGPHVDQVHPDKTQHFNVHERPPHQQTVHQRPGQHQPPHHQQPALSAQCGRGAEVGLHARVTTQRGEDGVTGYGEYPWHVAVLTVDLTYLCAGVLVAPRLVLTVAHCVTPLPAGTPLVVRVGDWDLASERELYPAYDVEVVRAVVHPEFYAGNLQNDMALLLLDPPVEGLPHVQPACLPPPHAQFDHQHCWVPGWGQARHVSGDIHDPSSYSWVLREAPVAVVTPGACQHHLRTTHLGPFYQLPRRGVLCAAGRSGSDACFGDGGGALVCPLKEDGPDGPLYAAGLVSWGIGCGQDIPAVYTKVSDYHGWIVSVLEDLERSVQFQHVPGAGHPREAGREGLKA
ncbi:uncharacterized protein LOC122373272 [Amphibalanus amphitrite]|uniref:uncharacterized protein LOC122373272 n=1 Tax=Amphibalanus amphitrite TaxID=1232801 RepID=UPI001C90C570|nr:uncharacterized protein LOC122373272 [Amphibalanus amphitrite]